MKKSAILISFISLLFLFSCMSTSFVHTGYYHEPLPEDNYIKIVMDSGNNLDFDEVGIIEVRESVGTVDFDQIINKACDIARGKGADCIIFMNRSTSVSGSSDVITSTSQYLFKAVKLKNS